MRRDEGPAAPFPARDGVIGTIWQRRDRPIAGPPRWSSAWAGSPASVKPRREPNRGYDLQVRRRRGRPIASETLPRCARSTSASVATRWRLPSAFWAIAAAEEVVQETFVQAWRQAERFDPMRGGAMTGSSRSRSRALDRPARGARPRVEAASEADPSLHRPPERSRRASRARAPRRSALSVLPSDQRALWSSPISRV